MRKDSFFGLTLALLGALALPATTVHAAVSTDSLVGYWKFDEGTGTLAADSSGHGNNGTLTGGPTWSADPTNDISFTNPYALDFDGADDFISVPDSATFDLSSLTLTAWIKTSGELGRRRIVSQQTSGYWFMALNANILEFGLSDSFAQTKGDVLNDSVWHNVSVVRSVESNIAYWYVDGLQIGTQALGGSATFQIASIVSIGAYYSGHEEPFNGLLDDVRIYSRALSAGEIAALAAGNHTTAVWDGSSSTDWETAANWDINAVPDPFTHVIVRDTTNDPKLAASVSGASLTIEASSSLDLSGFNFELNDGGALKGGGTLKLKGNEALSNLGNLATTSTGTVLYYGTGSFTGLAAGDNYNNLTINDGLVGYWPFDNGSGLSATDKSGYGNTGTLTGGPTWSADPTNDISFTNPYALSFDGTDDYVNLGDNNTRLDIAGGDFTISLWVNHTLGAEDRTIFVIGDSSFSNNAAITINSLNAGGIAFSYGIHAGGQPWKYTGNIGVNDGKWHHIVATLNNSTPTIYSDTTVQRTSEPMLYFR